MAETEATVGAKTVATANIDEQKSPDPPPVRKTITCFLCGGIHVYPGPRYENHLLNEHGIIFDVEFMIKLSLYKQNHGSLPKVDMVPAAVATNGPEIVEKVKEEKIVNGHEPKIKAVELKDCHTQTKVEETENLCSKCKNPIEAKLDPKKDKEEEAKSKSTILLDRLSQKKQDEDEFADTMEGFVDPESEEDEEMVVHPDQNTFDEDDEEESAASVPLDGKILVFICPYCPKMHRKYANFKQHCMDLHAMELEDIESINAAHMTEQEYLKVQEDSEDLLEKDTKKEPSGLLLDKRRSFGKEWAPNSFSSTFTCYFCNEQFRKDYKLKLHLLMNHKNESPEDMEKAKEELTKSKLDGCIHKCTMCGSKYNSVANFTRHIKDVHDMSRAQYREMYGSSEVISRMFKCELCEKEIKHTRNIIGAHMKMVHLISWKEYQEILIKIRQGEVIGDLPLPELFECVICGVSVKYKREHLNKKHQITEEVYDELIAKKNRGEDIADALPDREVFRCMICDRECLDLKKHIERSHQITEDVYEEIMASKMDDTKRNIKQSDDTPSRIKSKPLTSVKPKSFSGRKVESPTSPSGPTTPSSTPSTGLSTDLQCYFGCDEFFKKDYQLYLHLKLRHRNEDPEEVKKAYEAADEEIALTRRSGSVYLCSLCNKQFNDNGAFYSHIQTRHNMQWREYKDKFGRCEIESSPFECKICNRVIKYDRNTVHTHLKHVHGINWAMYLDRIRKLRRGEVPDDLPMIEMTECRICNINVKYLRDHLRNSHKINEQEYESLFMNEDDNIRNAPMDPNIMPAATAEPIKIPKPPKTDIQDKTNKKCSSCNITFDSRRSFIEHCTTVHNMKFKTKSGVTISAPTLMKPPAPPLQQQSPLSLSSLAMKRKSSEPPNMIERPPPLKMAKPSFQDHSLQDSAPDVTSLHMAPQYSPSGVSKWNQCRYECCFCKKTTMSRSSMTSHIHNTHGIPIKEYKEANYPDIEVETNWFQCRLCPARTKFVKDCIAPHLKMSHNMDIEVYEQEFMQPEDWPSVHSQRSTMRDNNKSPYVPSKKPLQPPSQQQLQQQPQLRPVELPQHPVEVDDVVIGVKVDKWNKCKYKCSLCDWISIDSRQMRAHIATNHGMTYDNYVREYGSAEVITKRFRCELCNSEMKHCRQNIYAHMKDVHKITLTEYEERVDMKEPEFEDEMYNPTPITVPAPTPTQKSPGFIPVSGLLDNGAQPSRWNRCRFQCSICHKLSSEKRHIREHVVKIHGMSMPDYESQYGDCEIHTEYFFCGVCHAEVKHNLKNISLHLQNVHKMGPQEYEQQFGRLPDEDVILEQQTADDFGGDHAAQVDFGSHFLLDDPAQEQNNLPSPAKALSNPPKADVSNPRCKFCRACNRDFNRRQAFVEHCRNVHGMNIKFVTNNANKHPPSNTSSNVGKSQSDFSSGHPCDYCGKVFSNRSNRNRHIILSCEVRKNGGLPMSTKVEQTQAITTETMEEEENAEHLEAETALQTFESQDDSNEEKEMVIVEEDQAEPKDDQEESNLEPNKSDEEEQVIPEPEVTQREEEPKEENDKSKEAKKCPFADCEVEHNRSALMKKHLFESHNIQNVSVNLPLSLEEQKIKSEPMSPTKEAQMSTNGTSDSVDERKVPPLRVKLSGLSPANLNQENITAEVIQKPVHDAIVKSPTNEPPATPKADNTNCSYCNFKSNNAYILGRHQKACLKRKQSSDEAAKTTDTLEDAIQSEASSNI